MNEIAEQRIRPGKTGYWIALLIFLLGCGGSGWLLYSGISGVAAGLERVTGPGSGDVDLDKTGTYTVFYEYESVLEDGSRLVWFSEPPPMQVTLTTPAGAEIPMETSVGNFNYDTGARAGRSIGKFEVTEVGIHTLEIDYDEGPENLVLALGHEKGKATIKTVFGIIGILVSGMIASIIFIIVVIMRSRSKNRLREAGVQV
ncbi:MAG: hypothetical protein ACRDKT_05955 [Actinomycetota bacterium]